MKSPVDFPTRTRIHLGLRVRNLDAARSFYEKLFGQAPTKVRPGYVKFEVHEPPVNFTLNEDARGAGERGNVNHFGIQLKSTEELAEARERIAAAGLSPREEKGSTCCHALQDKAWVTDPEGNEWEFFVVLERDAEPEPAPAATGCCSGESCC